MPHPRHGLDAAFQTPLRLSLMAALGREELDFGALRDALETSDSQLSKAIAALEQAGYVAVRKGHLGSRPRTWVAATLRGRRAFERHLAALAEIGRGYSGS
ncbi:winged helix-turn-helix domain-containing protein [Microbacterium sp. zg.Y909]|uniref:winged helix-turn-helix domain-containing protein n=1 Tax=Microbacterium sp. zg.Y909 TaxID=2969413 RepID=UPI00214B7E47|nr:transcriptional regulator [Microbacterium sp. zg.Y909]MCR2825151.1 transcriptional regulator [Microbacterium sp. zg.Y909]